MGAYLSMGTTSQPEHLTGRRQATSVKVKEAWDEPGSGGLITALNANLIVTNLSLSNDFPKDN